MASKPKAQQGRGLSDAEIAQEKKFMEGLPRLNIAALLIPPIWGPAHGFWATILFYPAWLIADNLFYATVQEPSVFAILLSVLVGIALIGATVAFALVSQPIAAHRAEDAGVSRETYLKRQRWWAVVGVVVGLLIVVLATVYNLTIRPTIEVM